MRLVCLFLVETIMKSLNKALEAGNIEECHSLLMKPEALLPTVLNRSAYLYYNELNKEKKNKQQVSTWTSLLNFLRKSEITLFGGNHSPWGRLHIQRSDDTIHRTVNVQQL